ncbi:hypothetical protein Q3G72_010071 [Acer saccharum]|nr:hypothetical protein Q3G72_010071 [Acer saccharum]
MDVVRKRYHKLALLLHLDKSKHPKSETAFKLISEAYTCLSDSAKRRAFNLKRWKDFCIECNKIPYTNCKLSPIQPTHSSKHKAWKPANWPSKSYKFLRNLRDIKERDRKLFEFYYYYYYCIIKARTVTRESVGESVSKQYSQNGFAGNSKPGVDRFNNMSGYRNGDVRSGVTGNANLNGNIKNGSARFNRKMNGDWSEVKHGKKESLKSGRDNKSADGNFKTAGNNSSGSRFEVLNEEGVVNGTEENLMPNLSAQEVSNDNAKVALTEITNIGRKQNVKPGKGMKKIPKKSDRLGIKKTGFQGECSYFKGNMNLSANS